MGAPDASCCLLGCVCSLLPWKLCWGSGGRASEAVASIQMCTPRQGTSCNPGGAAQPALALVASGAPVSRPALGCGGGDTRPLRYGGFLDVAIAIHQNFMFLVTCASDSVQLHPPVFADDGAGIDKEACVIIGFLRLVFCGVFLALSKHS